MKRGRVVGEVWASRQVPELVGRRLKLVVETSEPAASAWAPLVVAIDTLDARSDEEVLIAYGSGARNVLLGDPADATPGAANRHLLGDAAIALIVDRPPPLPPPMTTEPPAAEAKG
jgi:microcompartment protein CcmK/EutM